MEKLKLEQVIPYLNHKVQYINIKNDKIEILRSISIDIKMIDFGYGDALELHEFKLILKPLSNYFENKLDIFSNTDNVYMKLITKGQTYHYGSISYQCIQWLCKNHYDFQNLIPKGLAIDINTLNHENTFGIKFLESMITKTKRK